MYTAEALRERVHIEIRDTWPSTNNPLDNGFLTPGSKETGQYVKIDKLSSYVSIAVCNHEQQRHLIYASTALIVPMYLHERQVRSHSVSFLKVLQN